jgi:AcrR family transcriptional regulator
MTTLTARSDIGRNSSCRARLLAASKSLFARLGYEQASTAAIAREAGTSESQLVRYFETKAGLLRAIFDESWGPLNERVAMVIAASGTARRAMLAVAAAVEQAFGDDQELAFLFLLEGRRVRGGRPEVNLSNGVLVFEEMIRQLVLRGQADGSFSRALSHCAIAAAVNGAMEGMVRDRLVAVRSGERPAFAEGETHQVLVALLDGLSPRADGEADREAAGVLPAKSG